VNGVHYIPASSTNEPMDIEQDLINNVGYVPPRCQNPLFKLQHQNSMPQQYYNAPMGYYPPPQPQNYPQQQPQGMFGNFIMNQLSNHMQQSNGSNKNIQGQPHHWN